MRFAEIYNNTVRYIGDADVLPQTIYPITVLNITHYTGSIGVGYKLTSTGFVKLSKIDYPTVDTNVSYLAPTSSIVSGSSTIETPVIDPFVAVTSSVQDAPTQQSTIGFIGTKPIAIHG